MAGKKRVDPIKQREKRAKLAAIGGVVLLLGVGAFEVPKMLKLMNQKPIVPPPAAVPAGQSALPGIDAPTTGTVTPAGELADTDLPPATAAGGQLISFDVFETKNPFRPQVSSEPIPADPSGAATTAPATATAGSGSATSTPSGAGSSGQTSTTPDTPSNVIGAAVGVSPPSTSGSATPGTTTTPVAKPTVSISVNNSTSRVSTGGSFPSGKPVFRLVSWATGSARVGIVGGSYSTGDPTITLTLGKAVTLRNTSDGQQYKLILLSTP